MTTLGEGNEAASLGSRVAPPREERTASGRGKLPLAALPLTVRTWWARLHSRLAAASDRARSVSVWTATPPSLAALAAYTAAGDWVPGEQHPVLEFFGKVYGYALALPVTAAAYAALWLLARPLRLGIALTLGVTLRIVW